MGIKLTAAQILFVSCVCEGRHIGLKEIPKLSVSDWANRSAYLAHGESFKSVDADAKYSTDDAPMQKEPQDELTNPRVQVHVWMWASRMGKTRMLLNGIGYHIDHEPATQLVQYPDNEAAKTWSKDTLQPMIDSTPALRARVVEAKGGESDNTVNHKKYRGGHVSVIGSNSPTRLRQRTARIVIGDEVDGYRSSSGKEGDPLRLLFNRAKNYRRPVRLVSSTPTVKGHSRIESWFLKSDQRKWFVKCQAKDCGEWQTMKWARYKWPKDERDKTRYHCEVCNYAHNERQRDRMIREGEWRPTAPFKGIRGYWLPGYYSIFPHAEAFKGKMHEMAEEVHNAKHSHDRAETIKVLVQTFFAETYQEEQDVKAEWRSLYDRREEYKPAAA